MFLLKVFVNYGNSWVLMNVNKKLFVVSFWFYLLLCSLIWMLIYNVRMVRWGIIYDMINLFVNKDIVI